MKTRILSLVLCVLMLVSMVPVSVSAAANAAKIGTTEYATLAEALDAASKMSGAVTVTLLTNAELTTTKELFPNAGAAVTGITIEGGQYTLTATGNGADGFETKTQIPVTFRNMKLVDTSFYTYENGENAWEFTYLEFKGNWTFDNVAFDDGVLFDGGSFNFAECSFSGHNNDSSTYGNVTMYGAWVHSGAAVFTDCSFTGTRGLKVHEAYGSDVTSVAVDSCTFGPLSEKPGIALGTLDATTTFSVENSTFNDVKAGDQSKFILETDTALDSFNFKAEENTITIPAAKVDAPDTAFPDGWALVNGTYYSPCYQATASLTVDSTALEGEGMVTLTLTADIDLDLFQIVCSDPNVVITQVSAGVYTAELPNAEETFTFTASLIEDAEKYSNPTASVQVGVTYVAPKATFNSVLFALAARYAQRFDVLVSAENATVTGDTTIKYKRNGTVEIAVAEGYQLVDVIANGQSLGAVTSVTFKKVMAPQTLVVVTEPIPTEEPAVEVPVA